MKLVQRKKLKKLQAKKLNREGHKKTPRETFKSIDDKVPEQKLKTAIFSLLTETRKNYSCYKDICTQLREEDIPPPVPDCFLRVQYEARNCILNQDWTNFSRLLSVMTNSLSYYSLPILKYFLIAMLYDPEIKDKDYLQAFLSSVFDCNTPAEMKNFLREVSTLKKMEWTNKNTGNVQIQKKIILPQVNMDEIDLENANNVRKLLMGQKRRVSTIHRKSAKKTYRTH